MIPRSILQNLAGLRQRERLILFVWGVARWIAIVVALLLVCGVIDWFADRDQDTPWEVRYTLFGIQVVVATIAACLWVLWPQMKRLHDDKLALEVEGHVADFGHRLISAVQLNRPGADLGGMSPELVAVVTREAEQRANQLSFAVLADHRRLRRGFAIVLPVLLVAALPFLIWPEISKALLARQALRDVAIPRSVHLENETAEVRPIGDKVAIRYRVTGPGLRDDLAGFVTVTPDGQASDRHDLELVKLEKDGEAVFGVELPPGTQDFSFSARLGDGRSHKPGRVTFVPRPVITKQRAWAQLPASCGLRPDGGRYEVQQGSGDVAGIPGSRARVAIEIQKPVKDAVVEIWGVDKLDSSKEKEEDTPPIETLKRTVKMKLGKDGASAEAVFDLAPLETTYKLIVTDEYGFVNMPPPRRSLRVIPEEAPQVFLLKDFFGVDADSDLEGLPVVVGGPVRIPYVAYGNYGLGQAKVLYRVQKKRESGNEDSSDEQPWVTLPLPAVGPGEGAGAFNLQRGVFENTPFNQAVPFHAIPSPEPMTILPGLQGGGRYFLQTKGLTDAKGKKIEVKPGDIVEYCVEIYADKNGSSDRPHARSDTRVATIVTPDELRAWSRSLADEENRLRLLTTQQGGVFNTEKE